jgi:hypothetical protein
MRVFAVRIEHTRSTWRFNARMTRVSAAWEGPAIIP